MQVSTKHRAVILALRNPGKVQAVLPKYKILREDERGTLLAVPHTVDVVRVLKNIGINVPHPIKSYYDWPCYYPSPMAHQIETAAFLASYPRAYCLSGMGSSKTLATLWAFDYLRRTGRAKRLLVVAPLSTLERTWADEVFRNFRDLQCTVLHGSKSRRLKLLAQPADVYVVNHDGLKVIEAELVARRDIDVVVLDELAQGFRTPRTERWKVCNRIIAGRDWVWGLTGTPIPNSPEDAYGQIKLLTPGNVPRSFQAFQDMVSRPVGPYKRVPLPGATDTVYRLMQPSIRYATRDCVDLPPTTYVERAVELTPEQMRNYKRMEREKVFELNGSKTVAPNEAVTAMKIIQLLCGAIYTSDGNTVTVESPQRVEVLKEVIEQAEGKVIVFCPVLGALDYITKELVAAGISVGQIDGRVPKNARDAIFSAFQRDAEPRVIVAQPGTMSHGLTLTAATVIVWYAPPYSNETFEQANARIVRPGQKRNTLIVMIQGSSLERLIYKRLQERGKIQGQLLRLIKEGA